MARLSKATRLPLMDRALELLEKNPKANYRELSEAVGVGADTVGKWYRNNLDGFGDRYNEVLKEAFRNLEGRAIVCMGELIDEGNFNAAKYVLDNRGYKAEDKIKADVNSDININVDVED